MQEEILYGPAPEVLIKDAHQSIRRLLSSEECKKCLQEGAMGDSSTESQRDVLVKKIMEVIFPILPIALRNKSLDGEYIRTALHLLSAAEFLFSQYETDIRNKANPAGMFGLCSAMHDEIKRAALYNEQQKPVGVFSWEIKSQYQTSLGLGTPFAKDFATKSRKRSRRTTNRPFYRSRRLLGQGLARGQVTQQMPHGGPKGYPTSPTEVFAGAGRGRGINAGTRGRDICYDYRAGDCRRGASCRYLHANH